MTGTFTIICGPSSVGKTSLLEDRINKSYRWTTRPRRDTEIDSSTYDGTQSTHGYFVTQTKFLDNVKDLVGVHRYPDPKKGFWYGFPAEEMMKALDEGQELAEQIIDFDAFNDLARPFEEYKLNRLLVLSDWEDLAKRMEKRDTTPDVEREKTNRIHMKKFFVNLGNVNYILINAPRIQPQIHNILRDENKFKDEITTIYEKFKDPQKRLDAIVEFNVQYLENMQNMHPIHLVPLLYNLPPQNTNEDLFFRLYMMSSKQGSMYSPINNLLLEQRPIYTAEGVIVEIMNQLGMREEATIRLENLNNIIAIIATDGEPPQNNNAYTSASKYFKEEFLQKMIEFPCTKPVLFTSFSESPLCTDEFILNCRPYMEALDKKWLTSFLDRESTTPGLLEIDILRRIALHYDFQKNVPEETIVDEKTQTLNYFLFKHMASSFNNDIANTTDEKMQRTLLPMLKRILKIEKGEEKISFDLQPAHIMIALNRTMQWQSIMMTGYSGIMHTYFDITDHIMSDLADYYVKHVFTLIEEEKIPIYYEKHLGLLAYDFINTAVKIAETPYFTITKSDMKWRYPHLQQPQKFIQEYWIGNIPPTEFFIHKFTEKLTKLHEYSNEFDKVISTEKRKETQDERTKTMLANIQYMKKLGESRPWQEH